MTHNTHEVIRNLSLVSSISLALLFFYFIIYSCLCYQFLKYLKTFHYSP